MSSVSSASAGCVSVTVSVSVSLFSWRTRMAVPIGVSLVTMVVSPSSLTAASHVLLMPLPTAIMRLAVALVARAPASAMNAAGHASANAAAVERSLRLVGDSVRVAA